MVWLVLFFVVALVNYAGPCAGPVSDWLLFSANQSCLSWPPRGVIMGARRVVPCGGASGSGLGACVGLFVSLGSADCYCKASIDGIFSGKILFVV